MSVKNSYARELQRRRMKRQDTLTQMMLDAACLAANETFHRKGEIIKEFCGNVMVFLDEIAQLAVDDAKDDPNFEYAKAKLDERLEYILGEYFQPWGKRYGGE